MQSSVRCKRLVLTSSEQQLCITCQSKCAFFELRSGSCTVEVELFCCDSCMHCMLKLFALGGTNDIACLSHLCENRLLPKIKYFHLCEHCVCIKNAHVRSLPLRFRRLFDTTSGTETQRMSTEKSSQVYSQLTNAVTSG